MGSSHAGEMCLESGTAAPMRRGKKATGAAEQKAAKQPQRGLGVAQLERIRLHNQMIATYRSGLHAPPPPPQQQVPFAAPVASAAPMPMAAGGVSSFQPYLTGCFEATDRSIIDVQYYYENLPPYSSSRPPATRQPPPVFVHDVVKDSSGQRLGQYQYWMSSSHESSGRGGAASTEELDLELRL